MDISKNTRITLLALLLAWGCARADSPSADADANSGPTAAEMNGKTVGTISIQRRNVFDTDSPEENKSLFRFINKLHIVTRESVIADQLLVKPGDAYDQRLVDESGRILRGNKYLYDASLQARPNANGTVDIAVQTKDVWTLSPELSYTRSGGRNKTVFGIEEDNLLGSGQRILLSRKDDVDRTSNSFEFSDRQIGHSWVSVDLELADNSDGHSNLLSVNKPFYALDTRRAVGGTFFDDRRRSALYLLGNEAAEYRHEKNFYSAYAGWSRGLRGRWVKRFTAGVVYDENNFLPVAIPTLPNVLPANRQLVYPYIGLEILEDQFATTRNGNQIDRSEDFYFGTRLAATLGWSDRSFGADREAAIYTLTGSRGFGSMESMALFLLADVRARREHGESMNATTRLDLRYYWRQSNKRLFFAFLDGISGHQLDLDKPIHVGGNTGLRGYPLRYQSGDSRMVLTMEQRYFTDWYPFRLFRVGAAVFADVGRVWGNNPLGAENNGWLSDVGFGLRLAPTRIGSRKILHIDLAFPLDGDPSVDSVQFLFELKRSF